MKGRGQTPKYFGLEPPLKPRSPITTIPAVTQGEKVCVQLRTSADNVTLLAFAAARRAAARQPCSNRSISPVHLAHSSKPASVRSA